MHLTNMFLIMALKPNNSKSNICKKEFYIRRGFTTSPDIYAPKINSFWILSFSNILET